MYIDFDKGGGLVPALAQDRATGEILMVAYMNEEAWQHTVKTGLATFWSRSRSKLWIKGQDSGHRLVVKEILTDCDQDAIVLRVDPIGPGVCHEGYRSCFFRKLENGQWTVAAEKTFDPDEVYA